MPHEMGNLALEMVLNLATEMVLNLATGGQAASEREAVLQNPPLSTSR
jgi:hypothetical protein